MEDSGFDSDHKIGQSGSSSSGMSGPGDQTDSQAGSPDKTNLKVLRKTSELQRKLERQRVAARKVRENALQQPRSNLLSRNRLVVPVRPPADQEPLVRMDSDESEDEFAVPQLSRQAQKEITQQLIKDGYNLDLEPDDEDLDLIPPRPLQDRCVCCNMHLTCAIQ